MEKKKSSQLKDFQHKLSKKMDNKTKANTIIIGDLKVKNMAQSNKQKGKRKKAQNRSTQNQGYLSLFIGFLAYKAELIGKRIKKSMKAILPKCAVFVEIILIEMEIVL